MLTKCIEALSCRHEQLYDFEALAALYIVHKSDGSFLWKRAKMQKASCEIRKPVLCLSQLNGNVTDNDTDIGTETDTNEVDEERF